MPAYDALLMLRTAAAGAMVADFVAAAPITLTGHNNKCALRVTIPTAAFAVDTMICQVERSVDAGVTWTVIAQTADDVVGVAGKEVILPFDTIQGPALYRCTLNGTSAGMNFGVVQAGIVIDPGGDWQRN
jgi:hypothetical protein